MDHDQSEGAEAGKTIKLSRKEVSAARRLLQLLVGAEREAADELLLVPPVSRGAASDRSSLVDRAREEFHERRRRGAVFGQSMFGEPAWDMLLTLYILDISGQRQTIGALLNFSGTPATTAKRWLDYLVAHDLVRREEHPTDRRTAFVTLTGKAREKLDIYYSGTRETGM
ncbi:MAG TPA: MarR family transcriptional regulator [Sphingomicrobium sp.]|nr:MarR family transcriptional regulator [Sphingomicrobium sp.]